MNRLVVPLLLMVTVALAITAVASWIARKRGPLAITSGRTSPVTSAAVDRAMLMAQLRAITSLVFSVLMFLALLRVSIAVTGMVGLPIALTAGLSASAGLLLFSALPTARIPSSTTSSAALTPRRPWSFARRRAFAVPLGIATAYLAFLIATGLASSPDEQGRYRNISLVDPTFSGAASPFPGWFYGIPLMVVTLVLAGTALLALQRISKTRSLPDPRMAQLDRRWREISTQVVLRLATGALLGYFGGTAVVAGQTMINLAWKFDGVSHSQPLLALGITSAAVGAALALTGTVLLLLAAKSALTIRTVTRAGNLDPASTP